MGLCACIRRFSSSSSFCCCCCFCRKKTYQFFHNIASTYKLCWLQPSIESSSSSRLLASYLPYLFSSRETKKRRRKKSKQAAKQNASYYQQVLLELELINHEFIVDDRTSTQILSLSHSRTHSSKYQQIFSFFFVVVIMRNCSQSVCMGVSYLLLLLLLLKGPLYYMWILLSQQLKYIFLIIIFSIPSRRES